MKILILLFFIFSATSSLAKSEMANNHLTINYIPIDEPDITPQMRSKVEQAYLNCDYFNDNDTRSKRRTFISFKDYLLCNKGLYLNYGFSYDPLAANAFPLIGQVFNLRGQVGVNWHGIVETGLSGGFSLPLLFIVPVGVPFPSLGAYVQVNPVPWIYVKGTYYRYFPYRSTANSSSISDRTTLGWEMGFTFQRDKGRRFSAGFYREFFPNGFIENDYEGTPILNREGAMGFRATMTLGLKRIRSR